MMDLNRLRELMSFYDQQGMGSPRTVNDYGRQVPVRNDNPNAARMMFAQQMMGRDEPMGEDYFDEMPEMRPPIQQRSPMQEPIQNRLLAMMGRGNGYRA